ncbi:MAG: phosphotransferase family protein [Proteobacteria bacterium]|nr:phosphotransferase family protein [Pseudomonadota bacterium]
MPGPKDRDLAQTQAQLEAWLAPRLEAEGPVRIEGLQGPSETGFSSDTLLFDAHYRRAGREACEPLVARLKPSGFTVFQHYDVEIQYRVMDALADTPVPVPRMRWFEASAGPLGAPFYVMDRVAGRVPSDSPPMHTGGWVYDLSPEDQAALWWNGLDALAAVHRLDWRALGFQFLDHPEAGDGFLQQQLNEYDAFLDWGLDRSRYPLLERAFAYLREAAPENQPDGVCWGDARLGNQIFDGLKCVAVLDWEMVRLGNPVDDLAWWLAIDRCFYEGIGIDRLPGFPEKAATVARWEERTGREAAHLEYYEVLALFRFSAIMARVGLQMKHYGILPADHTMDRDNLASITLQRALAERGAA